MPIFEVERDGKIFELEAPDLQTGIKAMQPHVGGMQTTSAPGTEPEQEGGRWAPNPLTMAGNLPSSAYELGAGMVNTVAHPIETAQNIYNLGWDGFTQMLYDRYGSWDNAVKTMENDPAGFFTDLSMVGGPAAMGLKASSLAGKAGAVGKIASGATKVASAAAMTDPFAAAAYGAQKLGTGAGRLASGITGYTTGTGDAIKYAAEAGYEGALSSQTAGKVLAAGDKGIEALGGGRNMLTVGAKGSDAGKAYLAQNKGFSQSEAVVDKAKQVMSDKKFQESIEHNRQLDPIINDPTPLDIKPVRDAIRNHFNKQSVTATGTSKKVTSAHVPDPRIKKVLETVEYYAKGGKRPTGTIVGKNGKKRKMTWADLKDDPSTWKMNTFNQMQRDIGKIYGKIPYNDPVRKEIGKIYYSIRDEIDNTYRATSPNAAQYGDILKGSREAQKQAKEIIQTFSLAEGTAKDTALRKLYSALRPDIAHGNFGSRAALAQALVDAGHKNLMYELAGAHTRPLLKNSIPAAITGVGGYQAVLATGASPWFMATLLAFSPKVIGRTAYVGGKIAGSVIKPAVAIERALKYRMGKAYQPAKKAAQYGTAQVGRLAEAGENREKLKADILSEARQRGYQVHDRVLSGVVDKIMSDDPDAYLQGVRAVGRNPRLLKLFEEMGTKGER